jgi:hypothetical protein
VTLGHETGRSAARRADATSLAAVDWSAVGRALDDLGVARLPVVLDPKECDEAVALYEDPARFRKKVTMERLRFGAGEYQYFASPLPPLVERLRETAYGPLAAIANDWQKRLGRPARFPPALDGFLRRCHRAGQTKPTPLLLRYEAGGYNRLHQDLYGALAFPLQMTFLLSRPGDDFEGGEMLFVENRPREQSIGTTVVLRQGEGVVFAVGDRPIRGGRGWRRATLRHGVSRITSGRRSTLGIIFHDAR